MRLAYLTASGQEVVQWYTCRAAFPVYLAQRMEPPNFADEDANRLEVIVKFVEAEFVVVAVFIEAFEVIVGAQIPDAVWKLGYEDLSCLQKIQSYNYYHHRLIILLKSIVVQRNNLLTRVQLLESRVHCNFRASRILLPHIGPKPCLGFEDCNLDENILYVCYERSNIMYYTDLCLLATTSIIYPLKLLAYAHVYTSSTLV